MGTGTAFAEDAKENIVVSSIKDTDSKKYDACCAEGVFKFYGEPEKDWAAGRALWWPVLAGRCLGLTNWRIIAEMNRKAISTLPNCPCNVVKCISLKSCI